jgi:hypothetical protein
MSFRMMHTILTHGRGMSLLLAKTTPSLVRLQVSFKFKFTLLTNVLLSEHICHQQSSRNQQEHEPPLL